VIRLVGKAIGPATQTPGIVNDGKIATSVAGVQVTFDGVPVPLLYVGATAIECITPFGIAGHGTTIVQVTYNGVQSNAMAVPVHGSSTEVLVVMNQDYTINSTSNPAAPGSIMMLYTTGAGQTSPASIDGQLYMNPLPQPIGVVTLTAGGIGPLPVTSAVAASGLASGILQVNFQAPSQTPPGVMIVTINGSSAYFSISVQ
jgi:uncharacterized protein (TIGR03437 family)